MKQIRPLRPSRRARAISKATSSLTARRGATGRESAAPAASLGPAARKRRLPIDRLVHAARSLSLTLCLPSPSACRCPDTKTKSRPKPCAAPVYLDAAQPPSRGCVARLPRGPPATWPACRPLAHTNNTITPHRSQSILSPSSSSSAAGAHSRRPHHHRLSLHRHHLPHTLPAGPRSHTEPLRASCAASTPPAVSGSLFLSLGHPQRRGHQLALRA